VHVKHLNDKGHDSRKSLNTEKNVTILSTMIKLIQISTLVNDKVIISTFTFSKK
jgi:hypothetical protein